MPQTIEPQALPKWDLSHFYTSIEDPSIQDDFQHWENQAKNFQVQYEGKITALAAQEIYTALKEYEKIYEGLCKIYTFAYLNKATDQTDTRLMQFFQSVTERYQHIYQSLLFFMLELAQCADLEQNPVLHSYRSLFKDLSLEKPYQLEKKLESVLLDKSLTSTQAWSRLYDETLESISFSFQDKTISLSEILNYFTSSSATIRQQAAIAFHKGLSEKISLFTFITNTLAKDKHIDDTLRGYTHSVAARNINNRIEDEVIDALVHTVKKRYPSLTHRYYQLKAQWFGKEKLDFWDRNAPPPFKNDKNISWNEGKDIVLNSYREFSPLMADIAQRFFDENWIDAAPRMGKDSGAFSHSTIPSIHPYILLNYLNTMRDVATLAHELGHGIHQYLAKDKGILLSDTPLTVAETASVFGEMLTFQNLLKQCTDPLERKALLAGKVEDMLNTVARQIAFFDFELSVHTQRKIKELTTEDLGNIWIQTQTEVLGPAFHLDDIYRVYWSYISHFIHTPFYVYSYAFGDCLVNSLYRYYQQHPQGFAEKYIEVLKAGGTLRYKEILELFGFDATDPHFWDQGLNLISEMIDELERL